MSARKKIHLAILALIIANIIWGATPPIFKWALEEINPFTLAFARFFLASIVFIPFLKGHSLKISKRDWPLLFVMTFFGIFLHISFFFLGLEISSSINAPIIASAAPIFMIIGGMLFLKEHPGRKKIIGGVLSLFGVLVIVLLPIFGQEFDGSVLGNIFFILATIGMVVQAFTLKILSKKYNPIPLVFWSFVLSTIMFFPTFINEAVNGGITPTSMGFQAVIGIVFGGILSSALAYFLFYWGIKYLLAGEAGLFTYLGPVVTILVAIPLLGEIPTPTYLIGALLVFFGIYIAEGHLHLHPLHLFAKKE